MGLFDRADRLVISWPTFEAILINAADALLRKADTIIKQGENNAMTQAELLAKMTEMDAHADAVKAEVQQMKDDLTAKVASLTQKIDDLQNAANAVSPELAAKVAALDDDLKAIDAIAQSGAPTAGNPPVVELGDPIVSELPPGPPPETDPAPNPTE